MGRVQGVHTPPPAPPEMTCGFLIQLVFCKKKKTSWFIGAEVKHETRLKNYVKRRKIVVKMVVPKPGSDAELFMSRTQFEVRPTQIIKTG